MSSKSNGFRLRYLSIRRLVFLVKCKTGPHADSLIFTQYVLPDVVPQKVFFCGHDVTKFLTMRNRLTMFSYLFLCNVAFEHGFKVSEVRSFFKVNQSKAARKLRLGTVGRISAPYQMVLERDKSSNEIARSGIEDSVGASAPGSRKRKHSADDNDDVPLSLRVTLQRGPEPSVRNPVSSEVQSEASVSESQSDPYARGRALLGATSEMKNSVGFTMFKKFVVFDSALKLILLNIEPRLKMLANRVELYWTLVNNGVPAGRVMELTKCYLEEHYPYLLTPKAMLSLLNDVISFSGRRVHRGEAQEFISYTPASMAFLQESRRRWFDEPEFMRGFQDRLPIANR